MTASTYSTVDQRTEDIVTALHKEIYSHVEQLIPEGTVYIQVEPEFPGRCARFKVWLRTPLEHPYSVRKKTYEFMTETSCAFVKNSYSSTKDEKNLITAIVEAHKDRMDPQI